MTLFFAASKQNPHQLSRVGVFEFGGLGRNRTIDTRIFNAPLPFANRALSNIFSVTKLGCASSSELALCEQMSTPCWTIFTMPVIVTVQFIFQHIRTTEYTSNGSYDGFSSSVQNDITR
jgi:hypothetical protein